MFEISPEVAKTLEQSHVIREIDRVGYPHFLIMVPDLVKYRESEVGLEIHRETDGCVVISVLLYDIPTEPISYDLRFYPDQPGDLKFLRAFIDAAQFRLHPCANTGQSWKVLEAENFRVPANVLLKLKHFSLDWPEMQAEEAEIAQALAEPVAKPQKAAPTKPDSRDKMIKKLKEQNESLRAQLREKDKRIIEVEDELNDIKSRGRSYRLSGDRKSWWKPF